MLKGFRCPPTAPTAGTNSPIAHCLGKCPHPCASPPLLAAIYKADTENHHKGIYISASLLTGSSCPRQTVFERTKDFYELANKRYWSFRGTHAHSMVERALGLIEDYGWLSEMRMAVPLLFPEYPSPIMDGEKFTGKYDSSKPLEIVLGGTCDSYNPHLSWLWDMKSMADVKVEMMITGGKPGTFSRHLQDNWVKQLNIYRWLIAHTPIDPEVRTALKLSGEHYPAPDNLGIQGISMMHIPRTGAPYEMKVSAGRRKILEKFEVDSVPVWPLEETEAFIRKEILPWYKWLVLGDLPPVVSKENSWLCGGCAFNGEIVEDGPCLPTRERQQQEQANAF